MEEEEEGSASPALFRVEYAKSGRATCILCHTGIVAKGDVRIGVLLDSLHFEGKEIRWMHPQCFFDKPRGLEEDDYLDGMDTLEPEDRKLIWKLMASCRLSADDFRMAYTPSNRSNCASCQGRIERGAVRLAKQDYHSQKVFRQKSRKGISIWYHLECFEKDRENLGFEWAAKEIPGFDELEKEDQNMLKLRLPRLAPQPMLKRKMEDEAGASYKIYAG